MHDRGRAAALLALFMLGLATVTPAWPAGRAEAAAQVRGHTRWAVILCKFNGTNEEPQPAQFFRDFFSESGAGQGGLYDYWRDLSYGSLDTSGSTVFGWYTLPYTADQLNNLGGPQPGGRDRKVQACVDTAMGDGNFPAATIFRDYYGVAVMWNTNAGQYWGGQQTIALHGWGLGGGIYGWGWKTMGAVALSPGAWQLSPAAHEMGHGYGLQHSHASDVPGSCGGWGGPGEYCDRWDIMSHANVFDFTGGRFGQSGPGLNAAYRDALGWVSPDRTWTYSGTPGTIRLTSINQPASTDYLMARVPIDGASYYVVELRRKAGWDRAIPEDAVQVREVRADGRSYLHPKDRGGYDLLPEDRFTDTARNVQVQVVEAGPGLARVRIGPPIPAGPPAASLSPSTTLRLNTAALAEATATLTNVGGAALHVSGVGVGGANPNAFPIVDNACAGGVLGPGEACVVRLGFEPPSGSTSASASLTFTDDAGGRQQTLAVTGEVVREREKPDPCRRRICP